MLISLHDNYQRRIAHIDNALPKAMHYNDDKWNRNLAYGTGIFEFTIDRQDLEIESQLVVGNYISFRYNNRDYMFTILRSEKSSDDKKIIVHSEYLSLGLLKSTQDSLDPSQTHTLEWYLTQSGILVNSGIKLGINEVSGLTRKIKIDGEQTSLQRLTSFATNFGAEIEYVTTLNRDGTLKSLVVNFYKKFDGVNQGVGTNRQDLTLSYGKNVSGIKQTTDITDFFSMITPTGKDGLTITSLDRTEYDDDGNVLFFTKPGQSSIYAPQSAQRFPSRLIRTNNDYTDHKYSADGTSDQNTLYTLALNELKKHCDPSIVYDVTGFYDLNIGDTVKIFDASFNPPLMLQARVAEQTISFSNPSNNKTVFGNIIALESQASQDLASRLKELVDQATPYRFEIVSDNGLTFKNSTGSTTLTAIVYKGSNIDEVPVDGFEWLLDGVSFGGTTKSQLVNASQVAGTSVVRYNAKIGDTVIGGLEVTIVDVSDGASGRGVEKVEQKWLVQSSSTVPTYAWSNSAWKTAIPAMTATNKYLYMIERTTYTDATTSYAITLSAVYGDKGEAGANGSDGIAGKDGVGVKTTVITYAISTSGTTAPTTGWTSTVPGLVKGQYLWTKTVWTYTDNSSETGYSVTYISKDGNNGNDGLPGKDGVGISNTIIEYVGAVSGTSKPTTGWASTIPTVAAGSYLWTRYIWTYTDNTSETGYSVAMMGATGPKGDTGATGAKGETGSAGEKGDAGQNGADAWTVIMSNENVTLPANAQGGVTSYANSGTSISVIYGTGTAFTPVLSSATLANNQFKVSASVANITAGTQTVDTTNKKINYAVASGMSTASGAVASITYTISIRNSAGVTSTVTKVQNFTKAEKGITGDDGVDSYTYYRYSTYSNGVDMTSLPNADSRYIGLCVTTSATAPSSSSSYTWSRYAGNDANKYGDNVIRNPKWDNIPIGTYTANNSEITNAGWNTNGTVNMLAPDSDMPGEKIVEIVGKCWFAPQATPVVSGERYIISWNGETSDYSNQLTSPIIGIRGYPQTNNPSNMAISSDTVYVYPRVNGRVSASSGFLLDKTNVVATTSNDPISQSLIVEIPQDIAYIRVYVGNDFANTSIKVRKLEMRKIQQGAVIKSATEPSYKYVGMQWQYTGASAITVGGVAIQPSTIYIWSGSVWQMYVMRSTNLQVDNGFITNAMIGDATIESAKIKSLDAKKINADNISVISLNLGDMTGGTVKLMADVAVNDTFKKHGLYQSKLGLLSSGPSLATPSTFSNSQMGVANLNRGELRFIVTDYTEDLKTVQESGISDPNTAFIRFSSYDDGKDVMVISSSGDIVFNGITSQDTPWIAMGNGAYYKNMFSRVYISYSIKATSTANIPLGILPVGLRPFRGLHLTANAWGTTLGNDRHIEVRTTGEVTLYNPANGASYDGEVSFTL